MYAEPQDWITSCVLTVEKRLVRVNQDKKVSSDGGGCTVPRVLFFFYSHCKRAGLHVLFYSFCTHFFDRYRTSANCFPWRMVVTGWHLRKYIQNGYKLKVIWFSNQSSSSSSRSIYFSLFLFYFFTLIAVINAEHSGNNRGVKSRGWIVQ